MSQSSEKETSNIVILHLIQKKMEREKSLSSVVDRFRSGLLQMVESVRCAACSWQQRVIPVSNCGDLSDSSR